MSEQTLDLSRVASNPTITQAMIQKEQARIGTVLRRPEAYIELTSRDAIRHWIQGFGNRNPLFVSQEYGARSLWGDLIASPTIAMALTSNLPSEFRGLHAWHLGTSLEWSGPIRRDRTFRTVDTYDSLTEVQSSYIGGHTWDQVIRSDITDAASGEVAVVQRLFVRRFERDRGRTTAKEARQRARYEPGELHVIAEEMINEYRRGATPFALNDVAVGYRVNPIVRGPPTSVDCLAFVRGWGGAYILAHGSMWEFLSKHPGAFPLDASGIPDSPERTHWSDEFAKPSVRQRPSTTARSASLGAARW